MMIYILQHRKEEKLIDYVQLNIISNVHNMHSHQLNIFVVDSD